jgi:hypothetical protein
VGCSLDLLMVRGEMIQELMIVEGDVRVSAAYQGLSLFRLNRSVNGHLLSAYRHMAEKAFIALSDE